MSPLITAIARWFTRSGQAAKSAPVVALHLESLEERAVPTVAQTPAPDVFVAALYQVELGRTVDGPSLTYWRNQLNATGSLSAVVSSILNSNESLNREVWADFHDLLGRAPDAGGWLFYMQALQKGATPQDVKSSIMASDEYYALAGGTPKAFLNAVYQQELGRPVDVDGLNHWIPLTSDSTGRNEVAQGVTASQEATQLAVNLIFNDLLGRNADISGLATYSFQLQQAKSQSSVVASIFGSNEFYNRMQAYVATMNTTDSNSAAAVFITEANVIAP